MPFNTGQVKMKTAHVAAFNTFVIEAIDNTGLKYEN